MGFDEIMGRMPAFVGCNLVRGIKITDYCDQNNLTTAERLRPNFVAFAGDA